MRGLLKTIIKPDWDDNPKRSEILNAANLLQIGEFQLIQLAYKVTANSLYGQVGASTSPIYLKDIAASTTAVGRNNLIFAKEYSEQNYPGCKAVYGDSVMPYTPIRIRDNDNNTKLN